MKIKSLFFKKNQNTSTLQSFHHLKKFALLFMIFVLIGSLFYGSVIPVGVSQSAVVVDFSFTNEWGTYEGSVHYETGTIYSPIILFLPLLLLWR